MVDVTWEEKLRFLTDQDHQMRNVLLERGVLSDRYHPEMEKLHLANAAQLKLLIAKKGFPVLSNAGEQGVRLSWLIIMHSISLPPFMKDCLFQIRLAAGQNDYILELLAQLEDRIAYFEGRPQLYGTSADWINGELRRTPIEEPAMLNIRRRGMGLPPAEPLVNVMERPPKDPVAKEKEFREWLVRTGWRNE